MKILNVLKKVVGILSIVLFTIETCCVIFQILSRNFTGKSYATVEEFVIILLPYFALFAATYTMYLGNHVQIDVFYNKFPKNVRRVLYIVLQLAMIAAVVLLMTSSYTMAMKQMRIKTPAIGWPNGVKYLCFIATGPFMIPLFVHNVWRALHKDYDETQGIAAVIKNREGEAE